ncbi:serine/threonine-protein kinase [Nonomuraea jiangxiensis]|uniref:non-specific serine/threonine protein kinase n=1 Tax=Nonomuraea jiangxiensis TaxID=633440 RepID=A0A1G8Y2D2_9ACTN|nr:serine/threonine-protein kinase [Nonomuraea jiangxiensis]SDJ96210.1 Serine/threonine protein kinase [Nonomuraea jiangxiensis]
MTMMLAGRYTLMSQLGQGGMGTVWLAFDELLRQQVAIKEVRLPADLNEAARAELTERTLREARAAARLRSHPSIVTVHDVVMDSGRPWIVMELVNGRSLDRIVREDGPLPPAQVAWIGRHMLDALAAAHTMGVLHRDVKPGNVLLTQDGRVLLTDFGIATVAGDAALTQTGLLNGSPGYIAPERLRGEADGPQADLWSLGATLYLAVEGRTAYTGPNAAAVMAAVLLHEPEPPRRAGPLVPVLVALLEKQPQRRCTPAQASAWLQAVAQGGVPQITRPSAGRPAPRRRGAVVGGALALALSLVAGTVLWAVNRPGTSGPTGEPGRSTTSSATQAAKPATSSPAAKPLFGTGLHSCRVLTAGQVRTLLGSGLKEDHQARAICQYRGVNESYAAVSVYRVPTVDGAKANFVAIKQTYQDYRDEYPDVTFSRTPVAGEESFASVYRMENGPYVANMVLRISNVTAILSYSGPRSGTKAIVRAGVSAAAALEEARPAR